MSNKQAKRSISKFTFEKEDDLSDVMENFGKLLNKVELTEFTSSETKLEVYLALLGKLNHILESYNLISSDCYPLEWDDGEYDDGNPVKKTAKLENLSMQHSTFSDYRNISIVMDICDEILKIKHSELKKEVDSLMEHANTLILRGEDGKDDESFHKGLELRRRALEIGTLNNTRMKRKNSDLHYPSTTKTSEQRQADFSDKVSLILYPKNAYRARNINKTHNYKNQTYTTPMIKDGEDVLAKHRGYLDIAARVVNALLIPIGVVKGFYKWATTGNYNATLFSTKTESENLLDKVENISKNKL